MHLFRDFILCEIPMYMLHSTANTFRHTTRSISSFQNYQNDSWSL